MKKMIVVSSIIMVVFFAGCGQKEKPRYIQNQCPFCTEAPGKCLYCAGSTKCSYCSGTGTRVTQTFGSQETNTKKVTIKEKCPFCEGTGKCHYCEGKGICKTCKGTGKLEKWEW
jgi:DnaJ-class molecular chaperone